MSVNGDLLSLSRGRCEAQAFITGFAAITSIGGIVLLAHVRYRILTQTPERPKCVQLWREREGSDYRILTQTPERPKCVQL